jgi:hypothetical protein
MQSRFRTPYHVTQRHALNIDCPVSQTVARQTIKVGRLLNVTPLKLPVLFPLVAASKQPLECHLANPRMAAAPGEFGKLVIEMGASQASPQKPWGTVGSARENHILQHRFYAGERAETDQRLA